LPSAIDVVSKPGGEFNVLVSSEGSDQLFVFTQGESTLAGGGALPGGSSSPTVNLVQTPAFASANQSFNLIANAITTSGSATVTTSSASTSSSTSSVSSAATTSIGMSLGSFSSQGNSLSPGDAEAVLVSVEGNRYQSVPVLDFGSGAGEEEGGGQARMPWLSGRHSFGDVSALTRFMTGLDEALEDYRGLDDASRSRAEDAARDPWSEDLFVPHLPTGPGGSGTRLDEQETPGPGPRAGPRGVGALFREPGLDEGPVEEPIPASWRFARAAPVAGLVCAARALAVTRASAPGHTRHPNGPAAEWAKRGRQRRVEATSRESHS
jgi:hypothetical protein